MFFGTFIGLVALGLVSGGSMSWQACESVSSTCLMGDKPPLGGTAGMATVGFQVPVHRRSLFV